MNEDALPPGRITSPLRRRPDGTFEAIDWSTAIAEAAALLRRVRDAHGGEAILSLVGEDPWSQLGAMYARATRAALGALPLGEDPGRFHAALVDGADPFRDAAACGALEALVVIDVAMTETARLAHYVLPAASPDEQWAATFLDRAHPGDTLQLRAPLRDPPSGTLAQPEIHRRLVRALGALRDDDLAELKAVTRFMRIEGREPFADAFFQAMAARPRLLPLASVVLYETLGPSLPDKAAAAAALWSLCHLVATRFPDAVRRAGFSGESRDLGEQLFDAVLMSREGITCAVDPPEETWRRFAASDRRG